MHIELLLDFITKKWFVTPSDKESISSASLFHHRMHLLSNRKQKMKKNKEIRESVDSVDSLSLSLLLFQGII